MTGKAKADVQVISPALENQYHHDKMITIYR